MPFASPPTCTTFPRPLAPFIDSPFSPSASRSARSAPVKFILGTPADADESRALSEPLSAPGPRNRSCSHVLLTSPFGGRWFRFYARDVECEEDEARDLRRSGARMGFRQRDGRGCARDRLSH